MNKKHQKKSHFFLKVLIFVGLFLFSFSLWFNRVPERNIPVGEGTIVSPANGKVIAIIDSQDDVLSFVKKGVQNEVDLSFLKKPYKAIVIEMNVWNVHVQRSPLQGKIFYQKHVPGKYQNAVFSKNKTELAKENEKLITFIETKEGIPLGIIQVAGILARRIQVFKHPEDTLNKGEVFGRILLGSQVVLIVPKETSLNVHVGDILIDGESIIGTLI